MKRIDKKLADLKAAQKSGKYTFCPRCGLNTMHPNLYRNALSRLADIMVCDNCGVDEAKLAFMNMPGTLYGWAGLQPDKPVSDFKALPGKEVWERLCREQNTVMRELYERSERGESGEEIRLSAFESCPGLTQIWTQPFQMNYEAQDGTVAVRFKKTADSIELVADLIEGGAKK